MHTYTYICIYYNQRFVYVCIITSIQPDGLTAATIKGPVTPATIKDDKIGNPAFGSSLFLVIIT